MMLIYFRIVMAVCLFTAAIVALILLRKAFVLLLINYSSLIPMIVGVIASFYLAWVLDGRYRAIPPFLISNVWAIVIFAIGALAGCLTNLTIASALGSGGVFEWFVKPLAWLSFPGSVGTIVINSCLWVILTKIR